MVEFGNTPASEAGKKEGLPCLKGSTGAEGVGGFRRVQGKKKAVNVVGLSVENGTE